MEQIAVIVQGIDYFQSCSWILPPKERIIEYSSKAGENNQNSLRGIDVALDVVLSVFLNILVSLFILMIAGAEQIHET